MVLGHRPRAIQHAESNDSERGRSRVQLPKIHASSPLTNMRFVQIDRAHLHAVNVAIRSFTGLAV